MEPAVAKAMGVTNAVVAKAVMRPEKPTVPRQGSPVMIKAMPLRENPGVATGSELVMA